MSKARTAEPTAPSEPVASRNGTVERIRGAFIEGGLLHPKIARITHGLHAWERTHDKI